MAQRSRTCIVATKSFKNWTSMSCPAKHENVFFEMATVVTERVASFLPATTWKGLDEEHVVGENGV
jgi:hypothetical protein